MRSMLKSVRVTDDGQHLARHAAVTVDRRCPILVYLAVEHIVFSVSSRYTNQTHLRVLLTFAMWRHKSCICQLLAAAGAMKSVDDRNAMQAINLSKLKELSNQA